MYAIAASPRAADSAATARHGPPCQSPCACRRTDPKPRLRRAATLVALHHYDNVRNQPGDGEQLAEGDLGPDGSAALVRPSPRAPRRRRCLRARWRAGRRASSGCLGVAPDGVARVEPRHGRGVHVLGPAALRDGPATHAGVSGAGGVQLGQGLGRSRDKPSRRAELLNLALALARRGARQLHVSIRVSG